MHIKVHSDLNIWGQERGQQLFLIEISVHRKYPVLHLMEVFFISGGSDRGVASFKCGVAKSIPAISEYDTA